MTFNALYQLWRFAGHDIKAFKTRMLCRYILQLAKTLAKYSGRSSNNAMNLKPWPSWKESQYTCTSQRRWCSWISPFGKTESTGMLYKLFWWNREYGVIRAKLKGNLWSSAAENLKEAFKSQVKYFFSTFLWCSDLRRGISYRLWGNSRSCPGKCKTFA